jgi:hypothetical protein
MQKSNVAGGLGMEIYFVEDLDASFQWWKEWE